MSEDSLRYDKMVEDALRGVVRDALAQTAEHGLFGDHHFYITFRTRFPGINLPGHILARHPDEMTIVLQHQFWGLEVDDEHFEVTLSFSGVSERLSIPFAAITGFADPSAKFGLQFQVEDDEDYDDEDLPDEAPAAAGLPQDEPEDDVPAEGAKVIALDAFRKK
ncbi:MAG: ClpXP protease specificity-enhancing factor SspB [Magnetospirillum sp.]|nr:ClpXP protease specificity-enhancing factor SspB [Magnetospirillum sp.]